MKRKRLNRDMWLFDHYPYYQMRVETADFRGLVCLILLRGGVATVDGGRTQYWHRPKAGDAPICGAGMLWLQLVPDGCAHVLTAMCLPDHRVSMWYADVIDRVEYDPDGVAAFFDKYLDVSFTPQGDVAVEDRNELDEAFASGDIDRAQYDAALREGDLILSAYCADIPRTETLCARVLAHVLEQIRNGAPQLSGDPA